MQNPAATAVAITRRTCGMAGRFITFGGGEGAGKSTQAARLASGCSSSVHTVRVTREPGGTPLADAVRALLLQPEASLRALAANGLASSPDPAEPLLPVTEVLLLSAARAQHVARIRAWLDAGDIVISDRYADATRAYQGGGRGLDPALIASAEQLATGGLRPELTLLLDLPIEEGQRRRQAARWAA